MDFSMINKAQHQYSSPRTISLSQPSTASTDSSTSSVCTNPSTLSHANTQNSSQVNMYAKPKLRHKKSLSEGPHIEKNATIAYKTARQSLRPLQQPPNNSILYSESILTSLPNKEQPQTDEFDSSDFENRYRINLPRQRDLNGMTPKVPHLNELLATHNSGQDVHTSSTSYLGPNLVELQHSTTSQLKTLSKLTQSSEQNFSIDSSIPSVVGLHGRRQLKRRGSIRTGRRDLGEISNGMCWSGRNWMDQQRQFLQAYEYLCHIGEAKEWIEDIIHKPIPPIVQLEEALRDGVTLAEIVQALRPNRPIRIFRHERLQYRHSDNIAIFFRFLSEIDLPELFRFELIDLYEKKNIPKVIYCIHAVSWLLYRNGLVDFRIGNLVGQLEFEHHELEEMQKDLDKSGVNMPSFSGVGATFGARSEAESEEEVLNQVLSARQNDITEIQAQIRGCMERLRLSQVMQKLWDFESSIVVLQSRLRGDWVRQVSEYRLGMKRFATNLQSAIRGYTFRLRQANNRSALSDQQERLTAIQSLIRARNVRCRQHDVNLQIMCHNGEISRLQANIKGNLLRERQYSQLREAQLVDFEISRIQAAIRGLIERRKLKTILESLRGSAASIALIQSEIRGARARETEFTRQTDLQVLIPHICALQAICRAFRIRQHRSALRTHLMDQSAVIIQVQALSRGVLLRKINKRLLLSLEAEERLLRQFQAFIRGDLLRTQVGTMLSKLHDQMPFVLHLQSSSRGARLRSHIAQTRRDLHVSVFELVQLQAFSRGILLRSDIAFALSQLDYEEYRIVMLQASIRGLLVRSRFADKKRYYNVNMQKIIKVQSFVRAKQQGQAYKSLTNGKNPPVSTVKNFVHLLNDSNFDFDEEVEFERLRKTVVQHVRQNELADQYISQLDIKIALLVKNKITLDEVVKHQKHFGGSIGNLVSNSDMISKDPFDLKALNKTSRRKLEHYQELFFILQTQPQYLARLFRKVREHATPEKDSEKLKHLVMSLFGYAQKRREEYYLIKLIARSIKEEIDGCHSLNEYLRGNHIWMKIFAAYCKSPKDRKFMRELLGPIVAENITENPDCDLESDPMAIYLRAIENEQLHTGQRSHRRPDIPREEAIRDPETKQLFITHLQDLRDIVDQILVTLEDILHKMPYGVRYIAQQMFQYLRARFHDEELAQPLQIAGNWVWRCFLQPALLEPDKYGIIDRSLTGEQRRNLSEVAKVLGQIASAKLFGNENLFLNPLNSYISESIGRMNRIWISLVDVPDAETFFDIDEFNDLYAKTKPTLYIKMADIFAVHQIVVTEANYVCPSQDDVLREVIRELGNAKTNENELMSVSRSSEISLTLNPKLHDIEDPDANIKALFMETKRCILYIIRVQTGPNLMEIMVKPVLDGDELKWADLIRDELSANSRKRGAYADHNTLVDIASLTYSELKRMALENILRLEQTGRLTRQNHYQDVLNAIALDIRTKHRRRVQRARELEGVRLTLERLNDQAAYLDQQMKTYNDYIEQAMVTLQNKRGKKRFLMPFTKQWDHERELQRTGRVPKFGSFKYSLQELATRGIVISWMNYPERQWGQLDLTISSNEVGIFNIEGSSGSIAIPGATARVPLDDLLQAQYNGTQCLDLFGGEKVRVNVNLFLHLIMRKFYKDRES